jgi:hypothetical protein
MSCQMRKGVVLKLENTAKDKRRRIKETVLG